MCIRDSFSDDLGRKARHCCIQRIFLMAALLLRQHLHKVFEHIGARVAQGVYRMAHAVDQARSVEGFPVQQRAQIDVYKRQDLKRRERLHASGARG